MAFHYETRPHPTRKGMILAVALKGAHDRAQTEEEKAFEMIGGTYWRPIKGEVHASDEALRDWCNMHPPHPYFGGSYAPVTVCYTLSPAQARDLDLILRAGFTPARGFNGWPNGFEPEDRAFCHPDTGDQEYSRAEAVKIAKGRTRCPYTLEMDFG